MDGWFGFNGSKKTCRLPISLTYAHLACSAALSPFQARAAFFMQVVITALGSALRCWRMEAPTKLL